MIFSGVSWLAFSQQDPVLMRVNGKDVLRSEFEYYYNKDAASFASGYVAPEKYAERFADFKLKVSAAETAGLDTALSFREKVENYRNRLIKSYLTDTAVIENEARRLYDKMKAGHHAGRVRVSHIFKYLPQNVSGHALHLTADVPPIPLNSWISWNLPMLSPYIKVRAANTVRLFCRSAAGRRCS